MNDDDKKQLAEVALAALSGGLYALEHDNQLPELREQLDLLAKWARANNDPDGRMLQSVAMTLRLLGNGAIAGMVRRIAATLQSRGGE
jgi:hypothetical protein